jgi:ubiquinone/menaquinone biosynthesis C-methylase UbiE
MVHTDEKKGRHLFKVHMGIKDYLKRHRKIIFKLIPTLRIPPVSRLSLNIELKKLFKRLQPGIVLDVGSGYSNGYKSLIPHTKYMTLDINDKFTPDICCDLHQIKWESNFFDTVIAIEVLEHLYEPQKAINEIYRILKKGGICIASTRFIFRYHKDPKDYYRFTWDSLKHLFSFFNEVKVFHHGNKIQVMWEMVNYDYGLAQVVLNILNPLFARIRIKNTYYPNGFIVYAKK